jgi:23S rRNA (uracil1939-C5)-methyltransferase
MKLRIEKAIYGGSSLARIPAEGPPDLTGKAVFVPHALPGELVEASLETERRSYLTAALRTVIEPSPSRIQPGCEYYGHCGGCHYQHARYAAQLAMKRDILAEMFERAHIAIPAEIRTLSADPWQYRNRIRLHVISSPQPSLSYREAASHRDLAITHCPVAAPLLQQAIAAFNQLLRQQPVLASRFFEVEFFCNAGESTLLISIFTRQDKLPAHLPQTITEALLPTLPALRGIGIFALDPKTRRTQTLGFWGEPYLSYPVGEFQYRVSANAFFQINRHLIPHLLQEVIAERRGDIAWDLYAGVGLFAQALTRRFRQVVAVESSPASTADLAHNLRGAPVHCVSSDTLRFLKSVSTERPNLVIPDLVVVDPPRAGLGAQVCEHLAAIGAPQIVYVSCDPATLARDLRTLQPSGYRPVALTLVDLFPQTFHLETVVTLERA